MEKICKIKAQNPYLRKNLKYLRECCQLTQQQIANALYIDRSTYTYWECGKITPSIHKLTEIVAYYREKGINLDYNLLLDGFITYSVMQKISE
jgi:transcriptional regulator with XRE-family HTH domain